MNPQVKLTSDVAANADDSPLFVDLDGTLIVTDSLHESFVGCLRAQPIKLLRIPLWLAKGRARLKAELASIAKPDARLLPYDDRLCAFLQIEKHRGRRIYLATAADTRIARSVAEVVGLFDGIVASDGARNLKGAHKLAAIRETVAGEFSYAGNSGEDLTIWQAAASALVVNAPKSLERRAEQSCHIERVFPRRGARWRDVLAALRPLRWLKNALVFVPWLVTSAQDSAAALAALGTFLAFCACASATYLLTDLLDLEAARSHPDKRLGAFASGRLSIAHGFVLVGLLAVAGLAGAAALAPLLPLVLVGYMGATLAYGLKLRHHAVLGAIAVAALYAARLVAGMVALP